MSDLPDTKPALKSADQIKAEKDRRVADNPGRRKRDAPVETPLSTEQVLNLPIDRTLFDIPLVLRDLKIGDSRKLGRIIQQLPDVFIACALSTPVHKDGIDHDQAAVVLNGMAGIKPDAAGAYTGEDVYQKLGVARCTLDEWMPLLLDALLLIAQETPDMTRDSLEAALDEKVDIPDVPILLREIWRVTGGGYRGSMRDRFFRLGDGDLESAREE